MDIQHTDDGYVGPLCEVWARIKDGKVTQLTRNSSQKAAPWPEVPVSDPSQFYAKGTFSGVPQVGETALRVTGAQCGLHYSVTPTGQCHPNAARPAADPAPAENPDPENTDPETAVSGTETPAEGSEVPAEGSEAPTPAEQAVIPTDAPATPAE